MIKQLNESDKEDLINEILGLVSKFIKACRNTQATPASQVTPGPSTTVQQQHQWQSLPPMPPLQAMQEYHYDQSTNQTYYTI